MNRARKILGAAAVIAVAATSFAIGTARATNTFPDVSGFFDPAVSAGFGARCFNGFLDGTFKPSDGATRAQFAFWLNNCATRIEHTEDSGTNAGTAQNGRASTTVTAGGGSTGGTSILLVELSIEGRSIIGGLCNCELTVALDHDAAPADTTLLTFTNNDVTEHGTITEEFVVPTTTAHTFSADIQRTVGTSDITWDLDLTVTVVPFEGDGTPG